ncbi:beta-propeller domain-containing protein [Nocardioides dongkuii]|uniref:beta-propeller domain-containing protein n=1 Tax=Nocardioides dongkuii TaxID=2760089 RepID=UPI0015F917C8|nr:beta-propeller domain-containing protein [Nocardioides dongkuii]
MARPVLALGLTGALAGAFLAGTLVADRDPAGARDRPDDASTLAAGPGPVPAAAPGAPVSYADSCADLLSSYVERAEARVGPWGWTSLHPVLENDVVMLDGPEEAAPLAGDGAFSARAGAAAPAPATQRATSGESGTNVQEAGVDEPDVVKTDGELLVRLDEGVLRTYDVAAGAADGEPLAALGSVPVAGSAGGELLLAGDTVTVVVDDTEAEVYDEAYAEGTTRVHTVDVSDPAAPRLTATTEYDGHLLGARLHGSTVRVVVAAGLPDLDFVQPGFRDDREALEDNRRIVRETTIEDWLPLVTDDEDGTDGTAEPLLDCDAVALPDEDAGLDTLAVVGFEAGDQRDRSVQGLSAAADVAYFSTDHLYLAASHQAAWSEWDTCCPGDTVAPFRPGPEKRDELDGTTTVHDLSLDGTGTTYLASGRVDGHVADRWAVDEHDGVLRLAVGPTQRTGNFNAVLTLEQDGSSLVEVGRVDSLGVDEQIESVRWFDGLAIVVTFRQVDPLYAVDLTDPDDPTLLGELKIPGFSEYLHPLGGRRLVGVGQGPTAGGRAWGAQVGLFDVTDLADPRRIDVLSYGGGTEALAGLDPRRLTWLPEVRTVLTVVAEGSTGRTGYVSVITLGEGRMRNRMVEVEHGTDVDEVRTVPLGDGRVVLVTGDEVSFFDL